MGLLGGLGDRLAAFEQRRRRLAARLPAGGGPDVHLGTGVRISDPALVSLADDVDIRSHVRIHGRVSIGARSSIRDYAFLDARDGSITIGSSCSVNDYCVIYGHGGVTIGDDVRIATHTVIVAADHRFDDPDTLIRLQGVEARPITIEDDVWIGANVCILGGVEVGGGSVIGAGSVVTEAIPPKSIAVGNPARVIRSR